MIDIFNQHGQAVHHSGREVQNSRSDLFEMTLTYHHGKVRIDFDILNCLGKIFESFVNFAVCFGRDLCPLRL